MYIKFQIVLNQIYSFVRTDYEVTLTPSHISSEWRHIFYSNHFKAILLIIKVSILLNYCPCCYKNFVELKVSNEIIEKYNGNMSLCLVR